jgi:hypothetical protein
VQLVSGTDTLPPSHHNYDQHCCEQAARTTASADAIEELREAIAKRPATVWLWRDLMRHFTQPRFERAGGPRTFTTERTVTNMLQAMTAEGVASWAEERRVWGPVAAVRSWPTFKMQMLAALRARPLTGEELTAALAPAWRMGPDELDACLTAALTVALDDAAIEAKRETRGAPVRYGVVS